MIQRLIHTPIDGSIALLALVALIFIIDQLGLRAWIAWFNRHEVNRHEGKPNDGASKEYWRVHQ